MVADWLERARDEFDEPACGGERGLEIAALRLDPGEPLERAPAARIELERVRERGSGRIKRILPPEVVRQLAERQHPVARG